jgi:hypothetical protein
MEQVPVRRRSEASSFFPVSDSHIKTLLHPGHVTSHLLTAYFHHDPANQSTGAIWADLVPTVIALAIYFCFADFVLISQCLYYNHINARRDARHASITSVTSQATEDSPLLTRRRSSDTIGLPGSHRRRSSALSQRRDGLTKILEESESNEGNTWLKDTLSILGVIVVGSAGWVLAWRSGVWKPTGTETPELSSSAPVGAEALGYFSAVCYLGYVEFLWSSSCHSMQDPKSPH